MVRETIRVEGIKETRAKFKAIDKRLDKEFTTALKDAIQPVDEAAKRKIGRYAGASLRTIKPRISGKGVFERQNARKVTGKRGDFGSVQQRRLVEALNENREQVVANVRRAVVRVID